MEAWVQRREGAQIREVSIQANELERCRQEIQKAKRRFGLEESVPVRSCYEAGREGFWLHRALEQMGIENIIVDAASIEVNRTATAGQDGPDGCEEAGETIGALLERGTRRVERGSSSQRRSRR